MIRRFRSVLAAFLAAIFASLSFPQLANAAAVESIVYAFKGGAGDGAEPDGGLLNVGGTLYGTTTQGGGTGCGGTGCGTVFSIAPNGKETMLYAFKSAGDGAIPQAGLIDVGGTLYGTTSEGGGTGCGGTGCGTVFSITPGGAENVLYAFKGAADGAILNGGLLKVGNLLYGTTYSAGNGKDCRCGTVFSITTGGAVKVLYAFKGAKHHDGASPSATLVASGGFLYGTTAFGGRAQCNCGTVFSITTSGTEKSLYGFAGGADGSFPRTPLTVQGGLLYGTTIAGGSSGGNCGTSGCGTVFSLTAGGTEKVLYPFVGGQDGTTPLAGLSAVGAKLYGTTFIGGNTAKCAGGGCGTLFKITDGASVVYRFGKGKDGTYPAGNMIDVGGVLYGMTSHGGGGSCDSNQGCGTVFKVTSP
ncbi:MAG TPA: choice-of-anchor tandem repeat GloVer-containing protein [Rhizomicrobium sp.]|jgi:uncharacterized repeat protein (TIGR03803 family)